MLVMPGSELLPLKANTGDAIPHRAIAEFADAIAGGANDRRGIIGKDARQHRQIACEVGHRPSEIAEGLLAVPRFSLGGDSSQGASQLK
jgi:hypothetical protein